MNILEEIIASKKNEIAERKKQRSIHDLENETFFSRPVLSLKKFLLDPAKNGIIAEFKRRSPSMGIINDRHSVEAVTKAYTAYGASAISVLTDAEYFGGSLDDLVIARENDLPILRKDFIIDEYQVMESRAFGADAILLIAACLSTEQVHHLSMLAKSIGLEVLLELHDESELEYLSEHISLVGINNRNLKDFTVNLHHSVQLAKKLPASVIKIAESGISQVSDARLLRQEGFDGLLIGTLFMREEDPMEAFKKFSNDL